MRKMENIKLGQGFKNCVVVVNDGREGGLSLMWNNIMELTIMHFSKFHIQALVQIDGNTTWTFTGLYGHPITAC